MSPKARGASRSRILEVLRHEIEAYGQGMERKPAAVVANKIDALSFRGRLEVLERRARDLELPFFAVSAATGEGCREMTVELHRRIVVGRDQGKPVPDGDEGAPKAVVEKRG